MVYYAVIDTNVFISALLSKRADAATVRVLDAMFDGKIVPLYHEDILAEYDEVLHRSKFHFKEETIQLVINAVKQYGMEVFPQPTGEILVDMDDLVFYEVAMEKRDDGMGRDGDSTSNSKVYRGKSSGISTNVI